MRNEGFTRMICGGLVGSGREGGEEGEEGGMVREEWGMDLGGLGKGDGMMGSQEEEEEERRRTE
jgi:hypothetical protein